MSSPPLTNWRRALRALPYDFGHFGATVGTFLHALHHSSLCALPSAVGTVHAEQHVTCPPRSSMSFLFLQPCHTRGLIGMIYDDEPWCSAAARRRYGGQTTWGRMPAVAAVMSLAQSLLWCKLYSPWHVCGPGGRRNVQTLFVQPGSGPLTGLRCALRRLRPVGARR